MHHPCGLLVACVQPYLNPSKLQSESQLKTTSFYSGIRIHSMHTAVTIILAWENSWHFARSPLEPSQNDVWITSAEIPYWWRLTTQILVVLLIVWNEVPCVSTNQKHYLDLGSDASSVWNFCARYSDVISPGHKWQPCKLSAVLSGYHHAHLEFLLSDATYNSLNV